MESKSPRFLEEYKDIYSGYLDRARSLIVDGYWHLKKNRSSFRTKSEDFTHVQNAAEGVLEALQILLDASEGERSKPGVQPMINSIVDIINIHLDRIRDYYPKNEPKTFKTKEDQREEGKFQQDVFKGEQKIRSKIRDLNIENDMSNFNIEFFNNVKATIPFKDILCSRFPDIQAKIETLKVDWDLILDNELFINKQKRDIPDWNSNKHFWDQDEDTLQFWISEFNKIKRGITIDGVFISPWLYYHINFFKTPIGDKGDDILVPELRDNEWYLYEMINHTQSEIDKGKDGGMAIMGTRRYGKSTGEASWSSFTILTNPTKNGVVSSSSEKDILALTDKVDIGITYLPPAFQLPINSKDWTKQVRFGLKTKSAQEIKYFYLDIVNIDSGSKRGSQKLAGIAPILFVMDEFAKEKFIDAYNALIPALETTEGWKTIPWFTATGGDEDLSAEAEKALADPKAHRMVNMNWDVLNRMVPKKYRTWTERPFGWFIPAQMGQRTGHIKNRVTLSEFLKIDSEELSKIYIHVTDWANNTKVCKEKRKELSRDKKQLQKEIVYYPLDPEECFMSAKKNPFPAQGIKRHKEKLESEGSKVYGTARRVRLYRDSEDNGKVKVEIDNKKEVNEYPHNGSFTDCPFLLYDDFPEERPRDPFRFVAGLDDYKQDESDPVKQGSIGAFYIFDRLKQKIVLGLANRPDPHTEFHRQMHMALDAYNCKCFMENEDMDFKKYLDRLSSVSADMYLYKGFDAHADFAKFQNGKRTFGWRPDKNTVPIVRGYSVDYTKDDVDYYNEKDEVTHTIAGYERIEDVQLLEEMVKYKPDGNFDRLVAFGSCLAIDYYLSANYITPKTYSVKKTEEEDRPPEPKVKRNKFFTNTRRSPFTR